MKFKMTEHTVVNWIDCTYKEIEELLRTASIPYEAGNTKSNIGTSSAVRFVFYTRQFVFPWCDGDVVVGTLHCKDDYIISGEEEFDYPSIESYQFPWDGGDITVFHTPQEFVNKLIAYYGTL